jgi:hypothetical protein
MQLLIQCDINGPNPRQAPESLCEYDKNAGISILLGRTTNLPKGVKPRDLILMGDCVKKFRDQGIFIQGCPHFEMEPAWSIMDREYKPDPDTWKRDYISELTVFKEYVLKMRKTNKR